MREHRILRWCDGCAGDDGETLVEAVETFSVAIAEGEQTHPVPKVLDLCAEHAKALISPLADLLALTGQLPEQPAKAPERATGAGWGANQREHIECKICGKVLARGSMVQHVRATHLVGVTVPTYSTRCPVCRDDFPTVQGMLMHRNRTHGQTALDDLYAAARSAGLLR